MKQTDRFCVEIKESGIPTFIWGAGEMAHMAKQRLAFGGVEAEGFVVDDGASGRGGVFSRSAVIENYEAYNIVCGHLASFYKSEEEIMAHWLSCRKAYFFPDVYEIEGIEPIAEAFYEENRREFDAVRCALCDERSKRSLDAFLDEKISGDCKRILPHVVTPQYFFGDAPWRYGEDEVLFDCGAYDGDSIADFVKAVGSYERIIACEPDCGNHKRLFGNIEKNRWKAVIPYMLGLSDKKGSVGFRSTGDMLSQMDGSGDGVIHVDTIDNLSGGERVSIIKMDIEGAEIAALHGAEETIRRHRPLMMISAYHKKDDVYRIFKFIDGRVKDYSYFFRCHKPIPVDAVLYAVPNERLR